MATSSSAQGPEFIEISPENQATALWAFVHAHAPRFTMDIAREVVKQLAWRPGEDHKGLAKRLRAILQTFRISLKHTNALQAASRLAGFTSWHTNPGECTSRLAFTMFDLDTVRAAQFESWESLATELVNWADRLLARNQLPLGVLAIRFSGQAVSLSTPVPPSKEDDHQRNQSWPLGTINSTVDVQDWLGGAAGAFEKLRRHLEEKGHAVLDGCATLHLCAIAQNEPWHPSGVSVSHVANSELVVLREDDEDDPRSAYEIARGDEITCWYQLDLSLRDDRTNEMPDVQVRVPEEGTGAWYVNGIRHIWQVETLKLDGHFPGRVNRQIGIPDCNWLLRRYQLAKRIHGKTFKHHERVKHNDYLGSPPDTYRVDLHYLLGQLNKAGLTWESYIERFGVEQLPMADKLPAGFVLQLLEHLQFENANRIFAKPNLSEMARIDDDGLLRALMQKVDHVRYVAPRELSESDGNTLRDAVNDFYDSLRAHMLVAAGAVQSENELPHLVWATDAEELRVAAEALGLTMYATVTPHLQSTKGILAEVTDIPTIPWALGNALFLRFVRGGGVQ